jgi:hypothetical protein
VRNFFTLPWVTFVFANTRLWATIYKRIFQVQLLFKKTLISTVVQNNFDFNCCYNKFDFNCCYNKFDFNCFYNNFDYNCCYNNFYFNGCYNTFKLKFNCCYNNFKLNFCYKNFKLNCFLINNFQLVLQQLSTVVTTTFNCCYNNFQLLLQQLSTVVLATFISTVTKFFLENFCRCSISN